jgi:hypothetical protein
MSLKDFVIDGRAEFLNEDILIIRDFLPQNVVDSLLSIVTSATQEDWDRFPMGPLWAGRLLEFTIEPNYIANEVSKIFGNSYVFEEAKILRKLIPGDTRPTHYDSQMDPNCDYGIVYYLNEDFEGGEIFYPNLNIKHKPITNSLVIHSGKETCLHGINPVTEGVRYYMTLFADKKAESICEALPLYSQQ